MNIYFKAPLADFMWIKIKNVNVLICALLVFSACKKVEQEKEDTEPIIETVSLAVINPATVSLRGNLRSDGKISVLDHGFEYDHHAFFDTPRKRKISLGASNATGEFMTVVEGLNPGHEGAIRDDLYVRAYYSNASGTVYGESITVKLPRVYGKSISPMEAKAGDQITISGDLFLSASKGLKVFFEDQEAKVISFKNEEVIVEVPTTIPLRHKSWVRVILQVNGQTFQVSNSFVILASFQDFSPKSGPYNTELTFSGFNLPAQFSSKDNLNITVGGVEAWLTSAEQFTAKVLEGKEIKNKVVVRVNATQTTLPGEFTITPPVINSISPLTAFAGEQLVLKGSNFPLPSTGSYGRINFGDLTSSAQLYEDDVTATIPHRLGPGTYTVSFTTGPFTINASQKITVKAYQMTSFLPSNGFPLSEIKITGTFNKFQSYFVHFGNQKVLGEAISNTELLVNIPLADNGTILKPIVEMVGGQLISVPGSFTVKGPVINSVSPLSGGPGTQITIKGANFRPQFGGSIDFGNDYYAPLDEITETTIRFTIPRVSAPGISKLKLTINSQNAYSPSEFTVTK